MYEHRREPLMPQRAFLGRMAKHALGAVVLGFGALCVGMAGYHWLEGLSWVDAYLNAAMILGGMGPVAELHTTAGKIFAGSYALFAGVVFLVVAGVVLAPIVHRALHRFHADDKR
ncbi:MAG TPA: hypothetical protein VN375_16065 [Vicinamibacteria bacterium]|jgi:hypothetical protein|nr:hypothetical protein [Vicinamibacteria bacterium]